MHPRLFRRVDTRPVNNDWGRRDLVEVVGIEPTCTSARDLQSPVPPLEHHLRNEFVSSSTSHYWNH
jgi:hypothetical protein